MKIKVNDTILVTAGKNQGKTGRVTRVYQEDGAPHADLDLSATNQKGEVLIQGTATVRPWKG